MKRILFVAFLCMLLASVCWSQNPYTASHYFGLSDISKYVYQDTGSTNAFKLMPNASPNNCGFHFIDIAIGGDGQVLAACWYTSAMRQSYVFYYDASLNSGAGGWTINSYMGPNIAYVAASSSNGIYALLRGGTCGSTHFNVAKWSGAYNGNGSWTTVSGCLKTLSAKQWSDGTNPTVDVLSGVNNVGYPFISKDGGNSWTQQSSTPYWVDFKATDPGTACGIDEYGTLYFMNANAAQPLAAFSPAPPTGGNPGTSCLYNPDAADGPVLTVVNDPLVNTFDMSDTNPSNWKWHTVIGGSAVWHVSGFGKGTQIFVGGNLSQWYHLNIYAGFFSVGISGTDDFCPSGTCPSNQTIYHTAKVQVTFPHSLGCPGCGALQSNAYLPTDTIANFLAFDIGSDCDPLLGAEQDPDCYGNMLQSVICSFSGAELLSGGGGGGTMPMPKPAHWSEDVESFDATQPINIIQVAQTPDSSYAYAQIQCFTYSTCRPPTVAVCGAAAGTMPPYIIQSETIISTIHSATVGRALSGAKNQCFDHAKLLNGAWGRFSNYEIDPVSGTLFCKAIALYDAKPLIDPCF